MGVINKYLNSIWFILTICFITLLSYLLNVPYISFYALLISLFLILLFKADFKNVVSLIILLYASHSTVFKREYNNPLFIGLLVMLGIVIALFIVRIIQNRKIIYDKLAKDLIFYSLIAIFLSMIISLINTPDILQSLVGLCLWLLILLSYILVRATVDITDKNIYYALLSIILSSWVLSIEVMYCIILELNKGVSFLHIVQSKGMSLAWGNINHIAAFINISMILSFYILIKYKGILSKVFSLISICLFLWMCLITGSRGGFLALFIIVPLCLFALLFYKIRHQGMTNQFLLYLAIIVLGLSAFLIVLNVTGVMNIVIGNLTNRKFSASGRFEVYSVAIKQFKIHPIIGSGVYSSRYYLLERGYDLYNYHNYYLQILSTCGIIGGLTFTLYLVASIKRSLNKNLFSIFTLIIVFYFLIHGALDTLYFNSYIMPIQCVLLALIPADKPFDGFAYLFKNINKRKFAE